MLALSGLPFDSPITVRELMWAAEARMDAEWGHTSSLLSAIHNATSTNPATPAEFHPLHCTTREEPRSSLHDSLATIKRLIT